MPKINQKEYEVLKGLDDNLKMLGRGSHGWLVATGENPIKEENTWNHVGCKKMFTQRQDRSFQFIQWEDEEPYSISELIEEYEYHNEPVSLAGGLSITQAKYDKYLEEHIKELEKESEEIEVKSKQELIEEWESAIESAEFYGKGKEERLISYMKDFVSDLNQLDEPEILSQDWLDENKSSWTKLKIDGYYIPVEKLQNLLVPKQELPVIPQFVAEFLIGKEDYMLYELFDDEWLYEEHDRVAKWLYDNDELTNKQREIDLAMARERGYTVEEEQKYYVNLGTVAYVAKWDGNDQVDFYTDGISGSDEFEFHLTEQEIKDFDERFWPFAVKVEELEE